MALKTILKDRISDLVFFYRKHSRSEFSLKKKSRILLYHSIETSDPKIDKMGLAVPPDIFRMHMQYLKDNDVRVIDLSDLIKRIINNQSITDNSIVITFDDGYRSILTKALPILKEFGFSATLFVNLNFVERKIQGNLYWQDWPTLTWDKINELSGAGVSIGSHGVSHKELSGLNDTELNTEIVDSKEVIERNVSVKINMFSYPHGSFNEKVIEVLKKNNYACSCSSIPGTNGSQSDLFALKRTEITSFDNTLHKFEKKISGSYDWLGKLYKWKTSG